MKCITANQATPKTPTSTFSPCIKPTSLGSHTDQHHRPRPLAPSAHCRGPTKRHKDKGFPINLPKKDGIIYIYMVQACGPTPPHQWSWCPPRPPLWEAGGLLSYLTLRGPLWEGGGGCHGRFASIWRMALWACVCVYRVAFA